MNKNELVEFMADQADISKAAATRSLEAFCTAVADTLQKGEILTLVGFGSFYVGERQARTGRNPRTGEQIKIKASKQPKFRAGKNLKDLVQ